MFALDLLKATLQDVSKAIHTGVVTSEKLTAEYLARIERDNHQGLNLRAVIEAAPRDIVLNKARELDAELKAGQDRGPLHGVPILVKDTIYTDPALRLQTTGGTKAFIELIVYPPLCLNSIVPGNAPVIDNLLQAGAIIIGKANLTVLSNLYGSDTPNGWSPRGGQVLNPYTLTTQVLGSSSGSTVALAAGQCAASIGGETFGSITAPASMAAVYGYKPSVGLLPTERVIAISFRQDVLGPFGKSSWDVAAMLSSMANSPHDYTQYVDLPHANLTNFKLVAWHWEVKKDWNLSVNEVMTHFGEDVKAIQTAFPDCILLDHVTPPYLESTTSVANDIVCKENTEKECHEFRELVVLKTELYEALNHHLSNIKKCELKDLQQFIRWNTEHSELAFAHGGMEEEASQRFLRESLATGGDKKDRAYITAFEGMISRGQGVLDYMIQHDIDALLFPTMGGEAHILANSIGFPMATVPTGTLQNGLPIALWIMARPGCDKTLLSIVAACEKIFDPRPLPQSLSKDESEI